MKTALILENPPISRRLSINQGLSLDKNYSTIQLCLATSVMANIV